MSNMTEERIRVLCFVSTVHGSRLEHLLYDAEQRNGHERGYYEAELAKMLKRALDRLSVGATVADAWLYGHISYDIEVADYATWQRVRSTVDSTFGKWKTRFAIERMKEST